VLYILRHQGTNNWYFKITWAGKIALDDSSSTRLYYDSATPSVFYGEETYIPYRVFGNPWNGTAANTANPTLYTFESTVDGLAAGSVLLPSPYPSLRDGNTGEIWSGSPLTIHGTLYKLKTITWADMGITWTITLPLKIVY
jgi:hypothetical protein